MTERTLSPAALDAVIERHLELIIGDSRVFYGVLEGCSESHIAAAARERGFVLRRLTPGTHSFTLPQGSHAYSCSCGHEANTPCPETRGNIPNPATVPVNRPNS